MAIYSVHQQPVITLLSWINQKACMEVIDLKLDELYKFLNQNEILKIIGKAFS